MGHDLGCLLSPPPPRCRGVRAPQTVPRMFFSLVYDQYDTRGQTIRCHWGAISDPPRSSDTSNSVQERWRPAVGVSYYMKVLGPGSWGGKVLLITAPDQAQMKYSDFMFNF